MPEKTPPRLQVAIDVNSTQQAVQLTRSIYPFFDILEIGTPLLLSQGLAPLEALKRQYPDKQFLADAKIIDAGYYEARHAFQRGADIVTALGVADDLTIQGAQRAAAECGGELMVDLMYVAALPVRARQLEALGVSILCVHTAHDVQNSGLDPLADLIGLRAQVKCRLAIAGGLQLSSIRRAVALGADILVVGSGITAQADPRLAASRIYAELQEAV